MRDSNPRRLLAPTVFKTAAIDRSANSPKKNKPHTNRMLDHSVCNFPYPIFYVTSPLKTVTVAECALLREGSRPLWSVFVISVPYRIRTRVCWVRANCSAAELTEHIKGVFQLPTSLSLLNISLLSRTAMAVTLLPKSGSLNIV